MHCKDWEERIALHVGGDLAAANAAEAAQVEKHLAECADCQAFWSGMKESLKLLQGAHSEALASGAYTAVRARVMAGLEAEPSAGRAWRGAWLRWIPVGLAAIVAVILVLAWPARQLKTLPPRVVAVIPPAPAPPVLALRSGQARDRRQQAAGGWAGDRLGTCPASR